MLVVEQELAAARIWDPTYEHILKGFLYYTETLTPLSSRLEDLKSMKQQKGQSLSAFMADLKAVWWRKFTPQEQQGHETDLRDAFLLGLRHSIGKSIQPSLRTNSLDEALRVALAREQFLRINEPDKLREVAGEIRGSDEVKAIAGTDSESFELQDGLVAVAQFASGSGNIPERSNQYQRGNQQGSTNGARRFQSSGDQRQSNQYQNRNSGAGGFRNSGYQSGQGQSSLSKQLEYLKRRLEALSASGKPASSNSGGGQNAMTRNASSQNNPNTNSARSETQCFQCHGFGHVRRDCPTKNPQPNPSDKRVSEVNEEGKDETSADEAGESEKIHATMDEILAILPELDIVDESLKVDQIFHRPETSLSRLYIDVNIEGFLGRAFVDTGSDANLIQYEFYQAYLEKEHPLDVNRRRLTAFGGSVIEVEGSADLSISLGGVTAEIARFRVIRGMTDQVLIGDTLLRAFNVSINYGPGERVVVQGLAVPTYHYSSLINNFVEAASDLAVVSKDTTLCPRQGSFLELTVPTEYFR